MGCTRSVCSNKCFSVAQNKLIGRNERWPADDAHPGTFREKIATIESEEFFQSGGPVSSTSDEAEIQSLTSFSRNFLRAVSSANRSSARRREHSNPVNLTASVPSKSPVSMSFSCALRSTRDCELLGSVVVTQVPPFLSSLYPLIPVSLHGNMPNEMKGDPGSRYKSWPLSFTSTTFEPRRFPSIIPASKK